MIKRSATLKDTREHYGAKRVARRGGIDQQRDVCRSLYG
jgi:hypothetical protein